MTTCFISHTWRKGQHAFALRLRDALRNKGIEVWIDEEQILGGHLIKERMRKGIMDESDVFLFVLSPEALQSESCLCELNWAFERRREAGMQIIPILRKDCEIPESLQTVLHIDFRDDERFGVSVGQLLSAIESAAQVKSLCSKLVADEPEERIEAAQALARLGNRFTVPVVGQRRSTDHDPNARYWLAIALGKIGGEEAIAALGEAMGDLDLFANLGVTDALILLGKETLGVVLEAARSDDPIRRRAAAQVLTHMDEKAPRVSAALVELKNDPDERVRSIVQLEEGNCDENVLR